MDCFTLRVRSFGFFLSYTYRNRERSDAIHRSVPAKAESVDRFDNGLLHTSCSQFRLFFIFEIARPKATAIHSASSDTEDCFTLHVHRFGFFLLKKIKAEKTPPLSFLRILLFGIKTTATRSEPPVTPWTKN